MYENVLTDFILSIAIAALIVLLMYLVYSEWTERSKARNFYLDTVIAYKVGLITRKAEEQKINLIFPSQRDEFIDSINSKVESDLNRE